MKELNEGILFPDNDEMTRYGFISHMEQFIKELLKGNLRAKPDDFLCKHGIDGPKAITILTKRSNPDDENSAILIRQERITPMEQSEEDMLAGKTPKDKFCIKYRLPRKDYNRKMRNLYIDLFENHMVDNPMLDDDGEIEEATSCGASSGQFVQPLFGKPIKRTIYITEEQEEYLKKALDEEAVMDTAAGNFGYDAPAFSKGNKKDPAFDHKNMMAKSWKEDE